MPSFRTAARSLGRDPWFAWTAIVCIALSLGVNVATFGMVDALFLRFPVGVRAPNMLARVYVWRPAGDSTYQAAPALSYPAFAALNRYAAAVGDFAGYMLREVPVSAAGHLQRPRVVGFASSSFFTVLDARPRAGRFPQPRPSDFSGDESGAVIGYEYWRDEFGKSPAAIGSILRVGPWSSTITGIAEPGFGGADNRRVDVWVPLTAAIGENVQPHWEQSALATWLSVIVRLRRNSPNAANDIATNAYRASTGAVVSEAGAYVTLGPILETRGPLSTRTDSLVGWLFATACVVLLVGCANVAHLFLARRARREREMATRLALGASSLQIIGGFLVEGLLVAAVGGILGIGLACLLARLVESHTPLTAPIDARVVFYAVTVIALTGIACGVAPFSGAGTPSLAPIISSAGNSGSKRKSRGRAVLVGSQVALSVFLMMIASTLLESARQVDRVELGFTPDRVMTLSVDLSGFHIDDSGRDDLYDRLRQAVSGVPGVTNASLAFTAPMSGSALVARFSVPGVDSHALPTTMQFYNAIDSSFFETMGTRLLRGRSFSHVDFSSNASAVIVNRALARRYWPNGDGLGRCIVLDERPDKCAEIIGIVQDSRVSDVAAEASPQLYVPIGNSRAFYPHRVLLLRTADNASRYVSSIERVAGAIVPRNSFVRVRPLQHAVDLRRGPWRDGALAFSLFGILAAALAALGVYGLVSYAVTLRTHELGIHLALGASRWQIGALVVRRELWLALIGGVIGVGGSLAVTRLMQSLLVDVQLISLSRVAMVLALMLSAVIASSALPGWRAARIPPSEALRRD